MVQGNPSPKCMTYGVLDINAGIDNEGAGALTSAVIVGVGGGTRLCVGDTSQAPISVLLGGVHGDNGVLLNEVDLYSDPVRSLFGSSKHVILKYSRWGRGEASQAPRRSSWQQSR